MPLISDPSNIRSDYPFSLDSLPLFSNGVGITSIIDAETWNKIETAILRIQNHTQKTILFFDSADRKRVCVSGTATLTSLTSGGTSLLVVMSNFSAAQLNFINNNLQSTGSFIFADAVMLDGTDALTTNILVGTTSINVYIFRVDPTQPLKAGTYLVNLTILAQ